MNRKRKIVSHITTILLFIMLFAGVSLALYPTVANLWNRMHQTRVVENYAETVRNLSTAEYERIFQNAREYNRTQDFYNHRLTPEELELYNSQLAPAGIGMPMGRLEINSIGVNLPIYHGTGESVLQVGVGHLDWTALPIGGEGTHCSLSGHRGVPSSKLLTDLDKVVVGDVFVLHILNEVFTYEVDQILIVLPTETSSLDPEPEKDYVTLITCTPYAVNSHRLLVRGHRIENEAAERVASRVQANATQISTFLVAAVIGLPVLIGLFIYAMITGGVKHNRGKGGKRRA